MKHIAIIPDGSRRYSKKNNISLTVGYLEGKNIIKNITDHISLNYKSCIYLTFYILSIDNIKNRSDEEKNILFEMLEKFCDEHINEDYYRIRFIVSDESLIDIKILNKMINLETKTKNNIGICCNYQVAYGSRQSIIKSVNKLAINKEKINEKNISIELTKSLSYYEKNMPDPDFIFRTSGETRLSNNLLFELAYSEIIWIDKYWPEIDCDDIDNIIKNYNKKEKRFGK
jgi:tritrans,polycis-undecaprenyl-diphosphate synthase [geranylgeranyl-diphosphate specific]